MAAVSRCSAVPNLPEPVRQLPLTIYAHMHNDTSDSIVPILPDRVASTAQRETRIDRITTMSIADIERMETRTDKTTTMAIDRMATTQMVALPVSREQALSPTTRLVFQDLTTCLLIGSTLDTKARSSRSTFLHITSARERPWLVT